MHTLSIWPSKVNYWVVPKLSFEFDSYGSSNTRRRRENLTRPNFHISHSRGPGFFLCSRNSRVNRGGVCCGSSEIILKCGFLFKYSNLKSSFFKPKYGPLISLAWAFEQKSVGTEETNSLDIVSVDKEREDVNYLNLDEKVENNDDKEKEQNEIYSEKDDGEKKSAKIDVRALAWSLRSAKTASDVDEVLREMGDLPLQVYSSMIKGFGKDKRMDSALALYKWLKRKKAEANRTIGPNLFIYNSMLGAVKQCEKFAETKEIMSDMVQEGIAPNVVTYNTLMAIYLEQGEAAEAIHFFDEILRKGLTPSPASYSQALLAYRRMEDGDGALNFFINFREKYLEGDVGKDDGDDDADWENEFIKLEKFTQRVCYQVMRRWLVNGDNLSNNVLKLLKSMDNAGIPLGRAELERLVWACTREDHYIVAKELYDRIRETYSEISLSVCNHVIWLMGKAKKWWAALEVYEDLLDKGPQPNNLSYELIISHFNVLLTAARKRGIWRWGVRLLNKMEEKGLKPGSREWNAVLVACSKASETTAAVQIFKRMVEQGEKPTIISYGALLSALEKGKLYDEALRVWDHMVKMGVEPNTYAYTIMASIFTAQGKFSRVDAIIREMVSLGLELTVVTYNAIISGCGRNGMSSAAYEWFHRMKVQNINPNEITYEMLIEALAKDGKPRLAYELYLRAQNEGLNLSAKAYDAVLQSSRVFGATIDVSVLGPRPPDKMQKVQIRKGLTEFCNMADVPRRGTPFDRKEIYTSRAEGNH
ncbi:Pentatricopeptide repeat-containing protein [Quillaja saponaria]|uniref:Pentatricopeptide repeat-containing protein n=1 Tax=Quillaja saponaria TaxID=32244 RepID=A0AAD7Q4K5_QUISA|nr:Pentatricopeptide repeat-containing protein [Quillaja saponaria]